MKESLILKEEFLVAPNIIYTAWLDSNLHTKMTGGKANCSVNVGDTFSTWNGYIEGKNLELKPNKKIVQSWRTTEFFKDDEDSLLTLELKKEIQELSWF